MKRQKLSRETKPLVPDSASAPDAVAWCTKTLAQLALVVLVVCVFWQTSRFDLLGWDDNLNITDNPRLNPPTLKNVASFWRSPELGLYAPLSYTWFAIEAAIARRPAAYGSTAANPRVFHCGNVLLHSLCVLAVFGLLLRLQRMRLTNASDTATDRTPARQLLAAFIGAAVFAVHPLQVESVAWVTESRGLLAALLSLVSLDCYLRASQNADSSRRATVQLVMAGVVLVLALLAKPSAVAAPVMMAACAVANTDTRRRHWPFVAGCGIVAVAFLVVTKLQQPDTAIREIAPLWSRPFVAIDAIGFYLFKVIWPATLTPDYGLRPVLLLGRWWFYVGAIVPIAIGCFAWRFCRRSTLLWFLFFVAALLPVLGIVPFGFQQVSTVADRYAYLAMLGIAVLAAQLVARYWSFGLVVGLSPLLIVLALASHLQAGKWRNDATLFTHMLRANPQSFVAYTNLGVGRHRTGDTEGAITLYQKSIECNERYPLAWFNLGAALTQRQQFDGALAAYERSDRLAPDRPETLNNMARLHLRAGRTDNAVHCFARAVKRDPNAAELAANYGEALGRQQKFAEAERQFRRAVALRPQSADAHFLFAEMRRRQGDFAEAAVEYEVAAKLRENYFEALYALGELATFDENWSLAEHWFGDAVRCNPRLVQSQYQFAYCQIEQGKLEQGVARLNQLLQRYPGYVDPYHGLARAHLRQGSPREAIAAYEKSLTVRPDWFMAKQSLAWLYATTPDDGIRDAAAAVRIAEEANELARGNSASAHDTLAAAWAVSGQFDKAIVEAQRAVELARQQHLTRLADTIEHRLELYRAGQPFRDLRAVESVATRPARVAR